MTTLRPHSRLRERGISLIEALVAMGVMAFGMLAVVGLQVTLRANSDVAKQRAEAVRIAQGEVEHWRAFTRIPHLDAFTTSYDDLISDAPPAYVGINATYQTTRTITTTGSPPFKTLFVQVAWKDRADQDQSVQLSTAIAGTPPELVGTLALPPSGIPARQPLGRNPAIPVLAKDFGDRSGFVPPQPGGGTVTWVFNNTTGLIVGVCAAAGVANSSLLTIDIINSCDATTRQLLSGYVRFASTAALHVPASEARSPGGLAMNLHLTLTPGPTSAAVVLSSTCFDDAATVAGAAVPGAAVSYYCAIVSSASKTWAGRSRIDPLAGGWTISNAGAPNFTVCRYTPLANDGGAGSKNVDHPLNYTEAGSAAGAALTNQNFLVITAADGCAPYTGTRTHQDGTAAYDNP